MCTSAVWSGRYKRRTAGDEPIHKKGLRTAQSSGDLFSFAFQVSLGIGTHGEAFAADGNGDAEGEVCSLLCGALWLVNIFLARAEPLHSILMVAALVFSVALLISHLCYTLSRDDKNKK